MFSLGLFVFIQSFWQNQILKTNYQNQIISKIEKLKQAIKNISNPAIENLENIDKLEKFNNIKKILDTKYLEPSVISWNKMWDAALQAYVSALWDPFTVYLTAKDNESLHKALKWSSDFEWIWAIVTKVPEWILIEQVFKDSPAQKAWIRPLDIILQADWVDLADLPLWEAVKKIKWPAWTKVKLTIKRNWKILKIEVTRWKVKIISVNSEIINYKNKKLWYISISSVWEETYDEFTKQLNELLNKNIKWLIVDVRWNWGWYLEIWYDIWKYWAKPWQIIVSTKYRNPLMNRDFKTYSTWLLHNFPTVVLTNWYTASAWEIIAAAIRENSSSSLIVWTKTFWKWTIQVLKEFKDWSSLKYTIWKWYTPKWENVCKEWVLPWKWLKPDVEVKFDNELYKSKLIDNQLEKAKEELLKLIK